MNRRTPPGQKRPSEKAKSTKLPQPSGAGTLQQERIQLPHEAACRAVSMFACWHTAEDVAKTVNEEFGLDYQHWEYFPYDPSRPRGATLPEGFQTLFRESREKFRKSVEDIPIANAVVRMREYQKMFERAVSEVTHNRRGKVDARENNPTLALKILEQVAKETGQAYSRIQVDHTISGPNGTALQPPQIVVQFSPSPALPDPQRAYELAAAKQDVIDIEAEEEGDACD